MSKLPFLVVMPKLRLILERTTSYLRAALEYVVLSGGRKVARTQLVVSVTVCLLIVGMTNVYQRDVRLSLSQTGNTITIGTTASVASSLDPAESFDYFGWVMIHSLSSGLVEIVPGSDAGADGIRGALAESWTMSGGGTIWDFNLREGLTYFDGVPFNATAVKYSFDRNIGMALPQGPQLNIGYADIIDNVTVTGDFSVRFYLKIPFAPFLNLLSCAPSVIVHPDYAPLDDYVGYVGGDARASHPCGLGPFILTEWVRVGGTDISIRLERNTHYWNTSLPEADVIIIRFFSSDTELAAALLAGEIDVAQRLSPSQIQMFRDSSDFTVEEGLGPQIQYLCFQQNIYPFNETRIRQGIAAALNRSHMADVVFLNSVSPLYSIIPEGLAYHKPSFLKYGSANYTFTQDCLNDFGYNTTNKLQLNFYYESSGHYPSSAEQAAVYKSDLEASGVIDVDLFSLDWPTYRQQRNAGTMDVFINGWYPDYIDADRYGFLSFASWLYLGYNSTYPQGGIEQYNLWVDGRSATTDTGRQTAYNALQDSQADECSVVPLWQGHQFVVFNWEIDDIPLDISADLYLSLLSKASPTTPTTTTTTASTSTTTTTTNTSPSTLPEGLNPYLMLGIGVGGAAVIIIVFVLLKKDS
jgi:peptide/nickel transport system substrate-binding protein